MNKQYIKIHDGLYLDLSKAGEKSGHKYYKRVPKPTGKGYNYFYTKQQFKDYKEKDIVPGEKKGGILAGIMAFFGFKDEAKAQAKVKQVYESNKKDLSGVTVKTFADHMNEYLGNKAKWDARFSAKPGEKKEAGPKVDKPKSEKDKSGVMSGSGQKWDISLMKKIAGFVGGSGKGGSGSDAQNKYNQIVERVKKENPGAEERLIERKAINELKAYRSGLSGDAKSEFNSLVNELDQKHDEKFAYKPDGGGKKITAKSLMGIDDKAFDHIGAKSGGQIQESKELSKKYAKYVLDTLEKKGITQLSQSVFDNLEDSNFHTLNSVLAAAGFFGAESKKQDEDSRKRMQAKGEDSSYGKLMDAVAELRGSKSADNFDTMPEFMSDGEKKKLEDKLKSLKSTSEEFNKTIEGKRDYHPEEAKGDNRFITIGDRAYAKRDFSDSENYRLLGIQDKIRKSFKDEKFDNVEFDWYNPKTNEAHFTTKTKSEKEAIKISDIPGDKSAVTSQTKGFDSGAPEKFSKDYESYAESVKSDIKKNNDIADYYLEHLQKDIKQSGQRIKSIKKEAKPGDDYTSAISGFEERIKDASILSKQIKEILGNSGKNQSDKREITSQGDKINAAADKLDAAVKGGKDNFASFAEYMQIKNNELTQKLKSANDEQEKIQKNNPGWKKDKTDYIKIARLDKEIEKLTDERQKVNRGETKSEYRKMVEKKEKLSPSDMRDFPDLAAKQLKKESGIDFGHDEELAPNDIRARYNGEQIKVDGIGADGKIKVRISGNTLREWMSPAEVKTYLDDKKESSDKEAKSKQESLSSQEWKPLNIDKNNVSISNLKNGKWVVEKVDPKNVKDAFDVWGETAFLLKSPEGYNVTEKRSGMSITKNFKSKQAAIDAAKEILAKNGKERFKESIKRTEEDLPQKMQKASSIGPKIESEHKGTVDFITKYVKDHGKMPKGSEVYRSIAKDHESEMKDYYTRLVELEKQAKVKRPEIEMNVIKFLIDNPNPGDDKVHAFAEKMKMNPHELEKVFYKLATSTAMMEKDNLHKATDTLFEALEKAKYIKRLGSPGNYKYIYKEGAGKGKGEKPEEKPEKKPEKKPDEKKTEKGGLDEEKRGILKSALKKVANILAEALSGKDVNAPTGAAVEQTGENIKGMAKKSVKPEAEKPKEKPKKQEGNKK